MSCSTTLPTLPHRNTYLSYTYDLLTTLPGGFCATCFLLPRYRPRPPCCCCSVLRSLTLSQARAGSGMQPTIVLSDSPSIQFMRQDEGGRTKGRVRLFLFFFCSLSLFFLSFSLSLSSNRHANAKETDRQTDREPQLSSPRLASVVKQACLPKTPFFFFRASAFFKFFVPPPPPLLLLVLSPSIYQSISRSSKQVFRHHHIKWASNRPKPNSSSPRKLCANAIRISAGAIDLFIEVVDLCMLNEEVRIPLPPSSTP